MVRIAICDDEEGYLFLEKNIIVQYMTNHGYQYTIDTFMSGTDFLSIQKKIEEYDIIFLDINMSDLDGIETAKQIRQYSSQISIVFVTAFFSYALERYKVNAVRYLLKDGDSLKDSLAECLDTIFIKTNFNKIRQSFEFLEGVQTVELDDIIYIESYLHKLTFHFYKSLNKERSMYEKLDNIDNRICKYGFCRIHKSFLVNLKYVESIERYVATLTEGVSEVKTLNVSQSKFSAAKEEYVLYQGGI